MEGDRFASVAVPRGKSTQSRGPYHKLYLYLSSVSDLPGRLGNTKAFPTVEHGNQSTTSSYRSPTA